jgi:hypothetical protein
MLCVSFVDQSWRFGALLRSHATGLLVVCPGWLCWLFFLSILAQMLCSVVVP